MLTCRRSWIALLAACGAVISTSCRAPDAAPAVTEAQYLAARDSVIRSIAQRSAQRDSTLTDAVIDSASDALESMLRVIVGPFRANGFPDSARTNLATLSPEQGFGLLDGMRYEADSGRRIVVVTTRSLVEAWLKDTVGRRASAQSDPAVAFADAKLYAHVFGGGTAFYHFADLPVAEPVKRGIVAARLVTRAQNLGAEAPDEIVVVIARGTRFFFASEPTKAPMPSLPGCAATAGSDDERDLKYRRCYGEAIVRDSLFSVVVTQASKLASSLPVR